MPRKKTKVVRENHERWLITYSDLITLLLIFFIIMYSMSSIDSVKFMTLSQSLNSALNPNNQIPLQNLGTTALLAAENPTAGNQKGLQKQAQSKQQMIQLRSMIHETQVFSNLYQRLKTFVHTHGLANVVSLQNQNRGIQITLHAVVFFRTGEDTLRSKARHILQELIPFLEDTRNEIMVEGYTDNVPIHTAQFPSNWELSTGRAVNVLEFLAAQGIQPTRLSATGYGQYHPIVPNNSAVHRRMNRRVNIVILRSWLSSLNTPVSPTPPKQASTAATGTALADLHIPLANNNPATVIYNNERNTSLLQNRASFFGYANKNAKK